MLRALKNLGRIPLVRQARIVAKLFPNRLWYTVALRTSRLHGQLRAFFGGNGAVTEAVMLDNWLRQLTFSGGYPIPWRPGDISALERTDRTGGILYCWTHLPLVEMPLRAVIELGYDPPAMVADRGKITAEGEFIVPGLVQRVPAIPVGPNTLVRMRTLLREGRSVACMADEGFGTPLTTKAMHLVHRVGARLLFQWAEREPDGSIVVSFIEAPHPFCESEEAIAANLEYLRLANQRELTRLGYEKPSPRMAAESFAALSQPSSQR